MGESVATVLVALAVQFALGVWVRRDTRLEPLGLAEPLLAACFGAACVALGGVLLVALDVAMTIPAFVASSGAAAFVLGRLVRSSQPQTRPTAQRIGTLWWLVAALWCLLAFDTLAVANALPIFQGDEANIWAAKAKVIHGTTGTSASLSEHLAGRWSGARAQVGHPDYPWLGPLLQCWVHAFSGEIAHVAARVPQQIIGVCAVLATFELVRRSSAPSWFALALALAIATRTQMQDLVRAAMSESLVCAGVVLLLLSQLGAARLGDRREGRGPFALEALAAFVLVTAKNEGLALVVCWAVVRFALPRSASLGERLRGLAPLLPALAATIALWTFNACAGLTNNLVSAATAGESGRHFGAAGTAFTRDIAFDFESNALVPLLALSAYVWAHFARRGAALEFARIAAAFWCLASAAYFVTLATTPHDFAWHWETAGARIWANVLPVAAASLAWSAGALSRTPAEH